MCELSLRLNWRLLKGSVTYSASQWRKMPKLEMYESGVNCYQ